MTRTSISFLTALVTFTLTSSAFAKTLQVGAGKTYSDIGSAVKAASPGDVIEVASGTYSGDIMVRTSGTKDAKLTIRGVVANGKRPVISGGENSIVLNADHLVFEGFEVTGGSAICIVHKGDDITIRNAVIHDCPSHGVLGTDEESGSLIIEYTEVYKCGGGEKHHQLYIATDQEAHPNSVFRLQHSYVHDANGGNNVKSRAERNEIYGNWIEGAAYHELDLIGPDGATLRPSNSDVVGNVLIKRNDVEWFIARIGGDGTGDSNGRFRFVNNTMILGGGTNLAIQATEAIESIEMHNNVFYRDGDVRIFSDKNAVWAGARVVAGSNNWTTGGSDVPTEWTGTIEGGDPGFESLAKNDYRPKSGSALIDKGNEKTASASGHDFPLPLALPAFMPNQVLETVGESTPRPIVGTVDIGAYEFGSGPPRTSPNEGSPGSAVPGSTGGGNTGGNGGSASGGGGNADNGGCACDLARSSRTSNGVSELFAAFLALGFVLRRRAVLRRVAFSRPQS